MIPCTHWQNCGVVGGGCCAIEKYDRPSYGVCLQACTAYDGPLRTEEMISEVLKTAELRGYCGGVKRIVWLGIEWVGVPKPVRWWRWAFSHGHPHPGTDVFWFGCGCIGYLYDLREFWRAWQKHRYWKRRRIKRKMNDEGV